MPALLSIEALSLIIMSTLHLTGALGNGSGSYNPTAAGAAEAIICLVLVIGIWALVAGHARGRTIARGAVAFAILGFLLGITITAQSGSAVDITYHATLLPLLALTFLALCRRSPTQSDEGPREA